MKIEKRIILLILLALLGNAAIVSAQTKAVGKLNTWTFSKVASREKDDAVLPTTYKMRVSKNDGFDRIVFEFQEEEVPEYKVYYTKPPITIDPSHIENSSKLKQNEIIKVRGKAFVYIVFALGFTGKDFSKQFSGEQNLPLIQDIKTVDWFENFFTFAVGLNARKSFRVQELSNPTRLVIDFKY